MIILHTIGQTCNKFFIYLGYLGDSYEYGNKIVVLSPDITIKDYPELSKSRILKFPFYPSRVSNLLGYDKYIKFLHYIWENKFVVKFMSAFFKIIPNVNFVIAASGTHKSRNHLKYDDEIRKIFRPDEQIITEVDSVFQNVRKKADIICGVHIRYGDYKHWNNGKYYYSLEQYHFIMLNILKLFPEKTVSFFISSNEKIDLQRFKDCECFLIPDGTATKDLYGLSISDYLIGPPSTFSGWASYYGNTPLYFIENPNNEISKDSFQNILEIWE